MQGFLEWLGDRGGVERYMAESGIMTVDQIKQLRENLVVDVLVDARESCNLMGKGGCRT